MCLLLFVYIWSIVLANCQCPVDLSVIVYLNICSRPTALRPLKFDSALIRFGSRLQEKIIGRFERSNETSWTRPLLNQSFFSQFKWNKWQLVDLIKCNVFRMLPWLVNIFENWQIHLYSTIKVSLGYSLWAIWKEILIKFG